MPRNLDAFLNSKERSSSPYSYSSFLAQSGEMRTLAHHPEDGVVGGMSWESDEGRVNGIYVHPDHRNTSVTAGMLREAVKAAGRIGVSEPTGSASVTPHGNRLQSKFLSPESVEELHGSQPHVISPYPGTEGVETDLSRYADPHWDVAYEQPAEKWD